MAHTIQVEIPESTYESLALTAREQGKQLEDLAAQLLADALSGDTQADPFEQFIGAFRSDVPNWADQHDKYLGANLMRKLRGEQSSSWLTNYHQ